MNSLTDFKMLIIKALSYMNTMLKNKVSISTKRKYFKHTHKFWS